jgi:polyphosphate kinase
MNSDTFVNRELWWLEVNRGVLEAAQDPGAPLLKRLKSLALVSANLDEFFMGRIPALKRLIREGEQSGTPPRGLPTAQTLRAVATRVHELVDAQQRCFFQEIQPRLARDGIRLLQPKEITGKQQHFLEEYFRRTVFPALTPLAVGPAHPFPFLGNRCLCLLVSMRPSTRSAFPHCELSIVHVPSHALPRFIALPDPHSRYVFMRLEDVIRLHLPILCNGYDIISSHALRVTRDAKPPVPVRLADRLGGIEESSRTRRRGSAVRLQVDADVPSDILVLLRDELGLSDDDVYAGVGFVALSDLLHLHASLDVPPLAKPLQPRRPIPAFVSATDTGNAVDVKGILAHHP